MNSLKHIFGYMAEHLDRAMFINDNSVNKDGQLDPLEKVLVLQELQIIVNKANEALEIIQEAGNADTQ